MKPGMAARIGREILRNFHYSLTPGSPWGFSSNGGESHNLRDDAVSYRNPRRRDDVWPNLVAERLLLKIEIGQL